MKTDRADAVWLAKVAERGMCRPSLVHPKPIRQLRDLTRYRRSLISDRTREMQRVEKTLEDAQIKLGCVVSDIFGVSGRQMLDALIAGQRDPRVLAEMAKARMRSKIPQLREALSGFFTDHHALIIRMMLDNIDRLSAQIAALDATIEEAIAPFAARLGQLTDIHGVGRTSAQELIAEIGVDMSRFPSAAHLVSWARFCPQLCESAGRTKTKGRGKGNRWLASTLGNVAAAAARTDSFLGERYRRIARRRGKQKAVVATGHAVLTIAYHLLADPQARYHDLGAHHYESRINKDRRARSLAAQLESLTGQKIITQREVGHPPKAGCLTRPAVAPSPHTCAGVAAARPEPADFRLKWPLLTTGDQWQMFRVHTSVKGKSRRREMRDESCLSLANSRSANVSASP